MPISQIVTNSIANGAVIAADLAPGAARANFGAGAVLQVVNGTFSSQTDFTTAAHVDTGLTATITPSSTSSRILVVVFQVGLFRLGPVYAELRLLRNSSVLCRFEGEFGQGNANFGAGAAGTSFLDSPSTTSAVVYKTQCFSSGATIQLQRNSGVSTITLLEIAG